MTGSIALSSGTNGVVGRLGTTGGMYITYSLTLLLELAAVITTIANSLTAAYPAEDDEAGTSVCVPQVERCTCVET